jgi:3-(methylthio)propanoyl-CoA dehydrogenase
MIDYRSPAADILFALQHGAEASRLPGWDEDLAKSILEEAGRLVDSTIAPLDPVGDAEPARLENGQVRMPAQFGAAYRTYCEGSWPGLAVPEQYGGQGLPHVLGAALSEMLAGACISFQMVIALAQGAMRSLLANGSEAQRALWVPRLASGEWLATMCLTEPQAGSDLGLIRTTAYPDGAGGWHIKGGKIFISGGGQDMTGNVLHLVLARTADAPPGVKGLALFLCPTELEDGSRNAVSVVRLEDKMGMHASPTCQMAFDGAKAEIVGAPGEGLARMFTMMNYQRLDVAMEGVGLAEIASQRSRAYASERRQGRALGTNSSPAPLNAHADVQRGLLAQMALAQGCRAMVYRVHTELELGANPALVEFMTPVCKAFCTEAAHEAADLAIQVHGGYGYLREYRVEQILRDGRITRIYEGTNGIQGITLAGRLLNLNGGACRRAFHDDIAASAAQAGGEWSADLASALAAWTAAADALSGRAEPGFASAPFLRLSGLLAFAATWSRLEKAADSAPSPLRIRRVANFVRRWMLPEVHHLASLCTGGFAPEAGGLDEVFNV